MQESIYKVEGTVNSAGTTSVGSDIYLDRLSFKSCLVLKNVLTNNNSQFVWVLDTIPKTLKSKILIWWLSLYGIDVKEVVFRIGDLQNMNGEGVWSVYTSILNNISFDASRKYLENSKLISNLNIEWGRNTIFLFIAKCFCRVADHDDYKTVLKILIVDALLYKNNKKRGSLILAVPNIFTLELLSVASDTVRIHAYYPRERSIIGSRWSVFLLIVFFWIKNLKAKLFLFLEEKKTNDSIGGALLLLQEDDISMERSYRSQPHWIFKDKGPPSFTTFILQTNNDSESVLNIRELCEFNIYGITNNFIYGYAGTKSIRKKINYAIRNILIHSIFCRREKYDIYFQLMLLFMKGRTLAGFCRNKNIKSFMTSENYLPVADAVNLIGPHIGVHTLSYQYSNMSIVWPIMQSTAETMLVFSSMFIDRYKKDGIEARRYVKTGYVFDSSFDLVMDRAAEHKKNLYKRGANLIISYFNESIHNEYSKYGVIYKDDYYAEISALVKLVLDDKSVAVIIKPQFVSKTLSAIFPDDDLIMSGIATGRLIELHTGNHRNNVFPSEVAIASSIVIGHVIGATAGLESVLSGSRCILLNPNNMQGGNIDIFNRVDVLYENINLALDAINLFHRGDPKYSQLGVWDAIIDNFDPFRDGKSAGRLRKCIEESIG